MNNSGGNVVQLRVLNDVACKHGLNRETTCDSISDEVKKTRLPALKACSSCNLPDSIEIISLVNPGLAGKVNDKMGFGQATRTRTVCLIHNEEIMVNCGLKECNFYTTYPGVKNCSLVYMRKHDLDSLPIQDIAILTSQAESKVERSLYTAMSQMRQISLEESMSRDIEKKFVALESAAVCPTCEKPASSAGSYCSQECEQKKPKRVAKLEAICGTDIKNIVEWANKKYQTSEAITQALGLTIEQLNSIA